MIEDYFQRREGLEREEQIKELETRLEEEGLSSLEKGNLRRAERVLREVAKKREQLLGCDDGETL